MMNGKKTSPRLPEYRPNGAAPDSGPQLAVLTIVVEDNRVLLVRRANAPQAGAWGFPGGKVETGESVLAAAQRELREETGLLGGNARLLDVVDLIEGGAEDPAARHYLMVAVRLDRQGGRLAPADDAAALWWATPDHLPRPLCDDVLGVVTAALRQEP